MKKKRKDHSIDHPHPIWFALKIAAFMSFFVVPILAWQTGQNFWTKLHDKEDEQ